MSQKESGPMNVKTVQMKQVYQQALKALLPPAVIKEQDLLFTKREKIKVFYEKGEEVKVEEYLQKIKSFLKEISVLKIEMSSRKIQRLQSMGKWKAQSKEVHNLEIIKVATKDGYKFDYLIGLGSQRALFEVYQRLQSHSYKVYTSGMGNYAYRRIIQSLIKTEKYQSEVYKDLKVTSTEISPQKKLNKKNRRHHFVEFQFEIESEMSTDSLVEEFKSFMSNRIEAIGFSVQSEVQSREVLQLLQGLKPITTVELNKTKKTVDGENQQSEETLLYVVFDRSRGEQLQTILQQEDTMTRMDELVQKLYLLPFFGQLSKTLMAVMENSNSDSLGEDQLKVFSNFQILDGANKRSGALELIKKSGSQSAKWADALNLVSPCSLDSTQLTN